jgi:ribosome biogenesis GTPase
MVITVDRGRFELLVDEARTQDAQRPRAEAGERISAIKARQIGRKGVIVGDHVKVVPTSKDAGRIIAVQPRTTVLRRSADDTNPREKPIVANATQLAAVIATTSPEPNFGLGDRAVIAAIDAKLKPLVIATKCDLARPEALQDHFEALGVEVITAIKGQSVDHLAERLTNQATVLIGESGVGKSSLVNALVPDAMRETGQVSSATYFGRHTSSSVVAFALPTSGLLIDTPGLRTFGLAHITAKEFETKARTRLNAESEQFAHLMELVQDLPAQRNY